MPGVAILVLYGSRRPRSDRLHRRGASLSATSRDDDGARALNDEVDLMLNLGTAAIESEFFVEHRMNSCLNWHLIQ
jgi:hypothetical protein